MKKIWLATLPLILGISALLQAEPNKSPSPAAKPDAAPAATTMTAPSSLPTPLPADRFQGRVREAYKVAAEIPDVIAGVTCYCGCDKSQGHRNLLDCFIDDHGAT
jgi:predicted cobalt transporter CbtA